MASIFFGDYHVYYSAVDGRIFEFEKKDEHGKYLAVDDEQELIAVANSIAECQAQRPGGYSAFIFKLANEGKVKLEKENRSS